MYSPHHPSDKFGVWGTQQTNMNRAQNEFLIKMIEHELKNEFLSNYTKIMYKSILLELKK